MLSKSSTQKENNSCGGGGCGEGIVEVLGEGVDGSSPNLCVTTYINICTEQQNNKRRA